jgi:hypothetical protein
MDTRDAALLGAKNLMSGDGECVVRVSPKQFGVLKNALNS